MLKDLDLINLLTDSSDAVLQGALACLFEDLPYREEHKDLLSQGRVQKFWETALERFGSDPEREEGFKKQCRARWPQWVPQAPQIAEGPGFVREGAESDEESLVAKQANMVLNLGRLSEAAVVPFACLYISETEDDDQIRTSKLTSILRLVGYKIPNAATLIRTLAERTDPEIEIVDRSGPRNELVFRLLPAVAEKLRAQLTEGLRADVA